MFITIKKQLLFLFVIIIGSLYFILEFSSPGVEHREIQPATKTFSPKAGIEMKKGRQEYFFRMLRDPATGKIPEAIRERELAFAKELNEKASLLNKPSEIENITWKEAGPVDVGGRTRALAVDVKNPNTILAGGAGGGIWKSTDNGNTWQLKSQASKFRV